MCLCICSHCNHPPLIQSKSGAFMSWCRASPSSDAACPQGGWTNLHYAAAGGDAEQVRALIAAQADVEAKAQVYVYMCVCMCVCVCARARTRAACKCARTSATYYKIEMSYAGTDSRLSLSLSLTLYLSHTYSHSLAFYPLSIYLSVHYFKYTILS
jgi:hypothetical protein